MRTRMLRLLAVLLALGLIAAACGDDDSAGDGGAADDGAADDGTADDGAADDGAAGGGGDGELKIGYVLPQTGFLAPIVDALVKPIELAAQEITEAGGQITIVGADSGTDQSIASTAVDQLLNDGVDAIIGPAATGVTLGVIDKITGSEIIECSGSTTGSIFTTYDDGGYYFRTTPPDDLQSQVLADVMTADGVTSVGIIFRSDEYGAGFDRDLAEDLENNGVAVPVRIAYDQNATSFDAEVAEAAAGGVDALVLITFAEGGALMQGLIEAGLGPTDVATYVTDGFKDNVATADVDPDNVAVFEGIRGTAPSVAPFDGEPSFPDKFAAFAPDVPTIFSGHHYDCVNLLALASLSAGTDDPTVFVDHILQVSNDGTQCSNYGDCAALLEAGEDIDYFGASGPVDLSDVGEPTAGVYDVYEFDAEGSAVTADQVAISK